VKEERRWIFTTRHVFDDKTRSGIKLDWQIKVIEYTRNFYAFCAELFELYTVQEYMTEGKIILTRRRRVKRASGRITTWTILENWTKGIRIISLIILLNKALRTGYSHTILLSHPTPSVDGVGSSTDLPLSHYVSTYNRIFMCILILFCNTKVFNGWVEYSTNR